MRYGKSTRKTEFGSLGTAYSCARDDGGHQIDAATRVRDARYRSPTPLFVLRIRPLAAIRPFGSRPDASHRLAAKEHWGRLFLEAVKPAGPDANLDGSECSTVPVRASSTLKATNSATFFRSVDAPSPPSNGLLLHTAPLSPFSYCSHPVLFIHLTSSQCKLMPLCLQLPPLRLTTKFL